MRTTARWFRRDRKQTHGPLHHRGGPKFADEQHNQRNKMKHISDPLATVPSSNPGSGTGWRDIVTTTGPYAPVYVGEAIEENARLFAAAPDLLAALRAFVSLCPSPEGMGGHAPIGAFFVIAGQARLAIDKATA